jgi:hypothetical protein
LRHRSQWYSAFISCHPYVSRECRLLAQNRHSRICPVVDWSGLEPGS